MSTIAYLQGEYIPLSEAKVSVLDRGFLFADGIYEVIPVYAKRMLRPLQHLQRLQRSLDALEIPFEVNAHQLLDILYTLIEKNPGEAQSVYLQITRGAAATRLHAYPEPLTPHRVCHDVRINPQHLCQARTRGKSNHPS
jgi:D-alanine transaminase